jgi:hypothetical protein
MRIYFDTRAISSPVEVHALRQIGKRNVKLTHIDTDTGSYFVELLELRQ